MRGQRQDGLRERRVVVAVLVPAVADQDEVADPAGRRRRAGRRSGGPARPRRWRSRSGRRRSFKQLADVAEPRVVADQVAPALATCRRACRSRAARASWRRPGSSARSRGSAARRIAGRAVCVFRARLGRGDGDGQRVPEDLQVRPQPEATRGAGPEDAVEVDEDRLVLARGEAQVGPRDGPLAVGRRRPPATSPRGGSCLPWPMATLIELSVGWIQPLGDEPTAAGRAARRRRARPRPSGRASRPGTGRGRRCRDTGRRGRATGLGHVAPVIVARVGDRHAAARSRGRPSVGGSRANRSSTKTSVPVGWSTTISDDVVPVVRLPQLGGDPHVVVPVPRRRAGRRGSSPSPRSAPTPAVSWALIRRPSGDRQMKSVTNRTAVPSKANRNGHEPLSRCSATIVLVGRGVELAPASVPLGQTIRATSASGGRPGRSGRSARRSPASGRAGRPGPRPRRRCRTS